jgi:cobalt/nickel transport system permease protein
MIIGEIPFIPLIKHLLPALFFILGIGLFNPVFDQQELYKLNGIVITGGWLSFATLTIKGLMTVLATLLLLTTTTMEALSMALKKLKVPSVFIMQFMMTYRYIGVLLDEITKTHNAYMLRAPRQKGIAIKVWGSLAGQLLMRTFDRSKHIHDAMVMRGFDGNFYYKNLNKMTLRDWSYGIIWIVFFVIVKWIDIPRTIGNLMLGGAL